jgi:hypothetical protein
MIVPLNRAAVRNRITKHVTVRAGDLVPHEFTPRMHSPSQRSAVQDLLGEVGFARSLLGYTLPDGRIKLIDGRLRAALDPDFEVVVEVLDVTDEEARKLLLSLDPLTQLAGYDPEAVDGLRRLVSTNSEMLSNLWEAISQLGRQSKKT